MALPSIILSQYGNPTWLSAHQTMVGRRKSHSACRCDGWNAAGTACSCELLTSGALEIGCIGLKCLGLETAVLKDAEFVYHLPAYKRLSLRRAFFMALMARCIEGDDRIIALPRAVALRRTVITAPLRLSGK